MFCPNCGKADQVADTYCRRCGNFLPDFETVKKRETPPEQHIKATSYLSLMTAVVSLALALILYATLGFRPNTPWIIYLVAGFLIAITAWQVQTFVRARMLKKQFEKLTPKRGEEDFRSIAAADTGKLLDRPLEAPIPASVTENTTRQLNKTERRSPQPQQQSDRPI